MITDNIALCCLFYFSFFFFFFYILVNVYVLGVLKYDP